MKSMLTCSLVLILVAAAVPAGAQTKTIQGETKSTTATIEAIDTPNRTVSLKKSDGTYEALYVPQTYKRFAELKVGQTIKATHYENVVLQVRRPGETPVNSASGGVTPSPAGSTTAHQRTITATIVAIDPKVPSITLTGPNGWKYSSRVKDKELLSKLKVGEQLDITWTEALLISIE